MTGSLSSSDVSAIAVVAIVIVAMARRTYRLSHGAPYSPTRVFAYGGFSFVLFGLLAASTIYVAVGSWGTGAYGLAAAYAAVVGATAWLAIPHLRSRVTFDRRDGGTLYYRLPLLVPVLSLGLFALRILVEVALFGLAALSTFAFPATLPTGALLVLIGSDLTYGVSVGLLLGRGFGIRSAAERFLASEKRDQPLPAA